MQMLFYYVQLQEYVFIIIAVFIFSTMKIKKTDKQ